MRRHLAALALFGALGTAAADWPQFRGPAGDGTAPAVTLPGEFGKDKNVAWAKPLPGTGWAQPVAVGDAVYLALADSDKPIEPRNFMKGVMDPRSRPGAKSAAALDAAIKWSVAALDAKTGEVRWTKTVAEGKPKYGIHPSNSYATETPAADGKRVVSVFGVPGIVVAHDPSGKELWRKDIGTHPTTAGFGPGSSPALLGDTVFVQSFSESAATLYALNAQTGDVLWQKSRETPGTSWASPVVWKNKSRTEVVVCGKNVVTSHDPASGAELWRLGGIDSSFSSTPATCPEAVAFGNSGPGSRGQLFAVAAGASGDITLAKDEKKNAGVLWSKIGAGPGMASPLASGGLLYVLNQGGLSCYDILTGEAKYKERLPKFGTVAASPVLAGDRILFVDESGRAAWVKAGPAFEVVGTGKLDDTFWSSPAVVGDALLLRGIRTLYRVAAQ